MKKLITLKNIKTVLTYLVIYYLSVKMICFAIPKILFMQFRIPSYSAYVTLAEMSEYMHMWSFFGRSHNYNIFLGITEFLIGALILFKRTRLIALLISFGVCINILILNIEFKILFATYHILLDFTITIILLSGYRKDLYRFFIKLGGKRNGVILKSKKKVVTLFPCVFLILISVSYFSFSLYVKSTYIGDANIIGAYTIEKINIKDSIFKPSIGAIGKEPMIFLENNNQFILSTEDTLYVGAYKIDNKDIIITLNNSTRFGMKSFTGIMNANHLEGKNDNGNPIHISYKRISGKKNYLNDLYR
ncbi:hypothetical protein [uncultured Dokdonia sp.]|uniref:hypothetical protein n=1 Tax=uncultured Dokdonia sp. TaxID=575653 RepID=UPI002627EE65|nr:hypothetical protein [uncultured Dokdonia sp.]